MFDSSFSMRHIFILARYWLGSSLRNSWENKHLLSAFMEIASRRGNFGQLIQPLPFSVNKHLSQGIPIAENTFAGSQNVVPKVLLYQFEDYIYGRVLW